MAKVIVIFSPKGGVGKTFLISNLGVSLARNEGKRVCLIDLDLQVVSDIARMMNLNPSKSMADLINVIKLDPKNIKKDDYVVKSPLGVDFLAGVSSPQQSSFLEAKYIKDMLALFKDDYDFIIIDAGRSFNDILIAVLSCANLVLLVVTPDILSVYQAKWTLDTLQTFYFPLNMVKVVLNRAESAHGMSWQEVRVVLPSEIICQIPSDGKAVMQGVNRKVPVVIEIPKAKASLAIKRFSETLVIEEKIFMNSQTIDPAHVSENVLEKPQQFWESQGMAGSLVEPEIQAEMTEEILDLKRRIHARLIEEMNIKRLDLKVFSDTERMKELREKAVLLVANLLTQESGNLISSTDVRKRLVKEIMDEALGLGALEDLLADESITDIMVNNKDTVYIERSGKIELTNKKFISNEQVKTIIERIIAPLGRRIDESMPMVDARLADGSRVNAIISPLSLTGPSLTIRKFRKEKITIAELIKFKSLSSNMAEFIKACVILRKNIIVSGGTGSGKTTVLNILSEYIPHNERIITIEDAAELKLRQEHWLRLESKPPNIDGKGGIPIKDIFRNTLRMRPDRIIIGECRGIETMDMLQAMNTGHDGSMTTVHANSPLDVLTRLDSMILMGGMELPIRAIREMIAAAINIIIHTARLSDGTRKITQISEITGMKDETHIILKDIFILNKTGIDEHGNILGDFHSTGIIPTFFEDIKKRGLNFPEDAFKPAA